MTTTDAGESRRIAWIDIGRGVALVAMAIYHFSWDLEFFGYLDPGTAAAGPLKWFARAIASSFLILVGISLVLAHYRGIRWRGFWRRFGLVAAAAAAVTVATYFATPGAYVFFGILHEIAVASVLGLLFLRLPAAALAALAILWLAVTPWLRSDMFDMAWLTWTGLTPHTPHSNDFVPVFPWFSAVLAGMALSRFMIDRGWTSWLAAHPPSPNRLTPPLAFIGRHSLLTYLLHQPILIACVFVFSLAFPATPPDPREAFQGSCQRACAETADVTSCSVFCECAIAELTERGLFDDVATGAITQDDDSRVAAVSSQCAFEAGLNGE